MAGSLAALRAPSRAAAVPLCEAKAREEGSSFCEQKEAKKVFTALRAPAETPHSPPAGEAHDEKFLRAFFKKRRLLPSPDEPAAHGG
jgi:hypothetical protein